MRRSPSQQVSKKRTVRNGIWSKAMWTVWQLGKKRFYKKSKIKNKLRNGGDNLLSVDAFFLKRKKCEQSLSKHTLNNNKLENQSLSWPISIFVFPFFFVFFEMFFFSCLSKACTFKQLIYFLEGKTKRNKT